jgi:phage regulator Rha-like protein
MKKGLVLIPVETIGNKIYLIRGMKVILDSDLAILYSVTTKRLNEQLRRNLDRFPTDFAFRLTEKEAAMLNRSQFVTGSQKHRNPKYLPYAFTEQGVAMLASVLKSKRAVQMSIAIVRAFIKLRELLATHKDILVEIEKMKQTQKEHGQHIINILNVISQLLNPPPDKKPKEPMGFRYRG